MHGDLLGNEIARQDRDADAQVDVHAVLVLDGGSSHDPLAHLSCLRLFLGRAFRLLDLQAFNPLLELASHDAVHEDAGNVDLVGLQVTNWHDLFDLSDCDFCGLAHRRIEIPGGFVEDQVSHLVGLVGSDQRVVAGDGLLHDVRLAVELLHLTSLTLEGDFALLSVLDW